MTTSFQDIIIKLQQYWIDKGCAYVTSSDIEVGAGTLHSYTVLRCLSEKEWNVCYIQPSRRPTDGRFGQNPNRLGSYNQYQVIMKPSPPDLQNLFLCSLEAIGLDIENNEIRFVEDDWENPTVGAWGLGWEIWLNGMEIAQYTYMQQIGGINTDPIPGELTYGLERIAMYIQDVSNVYDLKYNDKLSYRDIYYKNEVQMSKYYQELSNPDMLIQQFNELEKECERMIDYDLSIPAYELCLKTSHTLNMLDARGIISVNERTSYISRVRNLAKKACLVWVKNNSSDQ